MNGPRSCFILLAPMVLAGAVTASAATYQVDSLAALQARIDTAVPGDVIVVKDGVGRDRTQPVRPLYW